MGLGIAYVFAAAGLQTTVVEPDEARGGTLEGLIADLARRGHARGKLTHDESSALPSRVHRVHGIEELEHRLDLVVESVPERLELKREVLRGVEARDPLLLASNTSSLSIASLAEPLDRPRSFLGMHFFNPVWSLRLVELIRGPATGEAALSRARELVQAIGRQAVVVADVPGFATSRLDLIAALEAMRMVQDGVASVQDIDLAVTLAYRHPVGPLRLSDIVGLDVRLDIARHLEQVYGERFCPPTILRDMVEQGRLGKKSGEGFYDWR